MTALLRLHKALTSGRVAMAFPPLRVEGPAVEMNLGSADSPHWAALPEEVAQSLCEQMKLEEKIVPPPVVNRLPTATSKAAGPVARVDATALAEALAQALLPLLTRKVIRTVERDPNGLITRIIETTE